MEEETRGELQMDADVGQPAGEAATALSTQDSAPPGAQAPAPPGAQDPALPEEVALLRSELEEVRARGLEAHRRALLAENRGRVVAELVRGTTFEEMDRSLEVAMSAFEEVKAVALAEMIASQVPAGNPVRQGPNLAAMTPLEKIAQGLKRE